MTVICVHANQNWKVRSQGDQWEDGKPCVYRFSLLPVCSIFELGLGVSNLLFTNF